MSLAAPGPSEPVDPVPSDTSHRPPYPPTMTLNGTLDATVDGDVEFTLTVTNTGPDPVDLTFRSGKRADVVVTDTDSGEEVWRWSQGRMFTQAISTVELAPGETLDRSFTWSDPPAGRYEAEGTLAANSHTAPATTALSV
jgi:hypothetical protein